MMKFKFDWFDGGTKEDWWFGASPEGFVTVAMIANFMVSILVPKYTPAPPKEVVDIVKNTRIPDEAGAVAH